MGADGALVNRHGRKPSPVRMRRFVITLCLHPVADADIIRMLESAPPRQRAARVREWLRSGRPNNAADSGEEHPDLEDLGVIL